MIIETAKFLTILAHISSFSRKYKHVKYVMLKKVFHAEYDLT